MARETLDERGIDRLLRELRCSPLAPDTTDDLHEKYTLDSILRAVAAARKRMADDVRGLGYKIDALAQARADLRLSRALYVRVKRAAIAQVGLDDTTDENVAEMTEINADDEHRRAMAINRDIPQ